MQGKGKSKARDEGSGEIVNDRSATDPRLPLSEPEHVSATSSRLELYPGQLFFPISNMGRGDRLKDNMAIAIVVDNSAGFCWGMRIPQYWPRGRCLLGEWDGCREDTVTRTNVPLFQLKF